MEKKYRLWTFQSIKSINELKSKGILEVSWHRYPLRDEFLRSYQWMAKQLAARKIGCNNHAPIWAWHSCGKYKNAPTLQTARSLLGGIEIQDGIQTIEFECPVELALLSSYHIWNMIMDEIYFSKDEPKIDKNTEDLLFKVGRKKYRKDDDIQATLPYLKLDWVKEIRELKLKVNDNNYDPDEEV